MTRLGAALARMDLANLRVGRGHGAGGRFAVSLGSCYWQRRLQPKCRATRLAILSNPMNIRASSNV
jgi:hypothetical protein